MIDLTSYGFEVVARAPSAEADADVIFDLSTAKACLTFVEKALDFKTPSAFRIKKFEPLDSISAEQRNCCRVILKRTGHEFIINLSRYKAGNKVNIHIMLALGTSHQLTNGKGRRASENVWATTDDRAIKFVGLRTSSTTDLFIRDLMATDH